MWLASALVAGIAAVLWTRVITAQAATASGFARHVERAADEVVGVAVVYQDFVARDAAEAGIRAPALDELSRKLPYRIDDARHVLEVGQPPLEIAGVRLRAMRIEDGLALEIANATGSTIAYHVVTTAVPAGCDAAPARLFNAMTIRPNGRAIRVECTWHAGIALAAVRVETVEVLPLSAGYLDQVPPSAVGIAPRIARGHRPPETVHPCGFALPQAVRSGLERGEIGRRDLIDFAAAAAAISANSPFIQVSYDRWRTKRASAVRGHVTDSAWLSLLLVPRTV